MKAFFCKLFRISGIAVCVTILFFVWTFIPPFGDVIWTLVFGDAYYKAGEAAITVSERPETLAVYKKKNKPFVLIHFPFCWEGKVEEDFFFVNPKQVIATSLDGGGDTWYRVGPLLFILDDMTVWDRVRMPYWDYLKQKDASIEYDAEKDEYVYKIFVNSPEEPAVLRCPARFFTPDLLAAPNDTIHE